MIHPNNLLRMESNGEQRQFAAPIDQSSFEFDCGFSCIPFLHLERFAKVRYFVFSLCVLGFLHSTILFYFRGTSELWSHHYDITADTTEWIIYINEIFIGVFALAISFWGNKTGRPKWIGILSILYSITCILLIITDIYKPCQPNSDGTYSCHEVGKEQISYVAFSLVITHQIFFALTKIALVSLGISYIDDSDHVRSAIEIGFVFASSEIGKQLGIYFSWIPYATNRTHHIYLSVIWIALSAILFTGGLILASFPKTLPNIIERRMAKSLVSLASGNIDAEDFEDKPDSFFKSFKRIMTNKTLLCNVLAMTLVQSGLINFGIYEKYFNETKYHVGMTDKSGYHDPALIQFTTNLLKQPLVSICTLSSGLYIGRTKPRPKSLFRWNLIAMIFVMILFVSGKVWSCTNGISNEHNSILVQPLCGAKTPCLSNDQFQPVCLKEKTYFSPCYIGCPNNIVDENCACANNSNSIKAGSCDAEECNVLLAISQVNNIIIAGLVATMTVPAVLINIKSVNNKDKALALGLDSTLIKLVPYLPVRSLYWFCLGKFCQFTKKENCMLYNDHLPLFLIFTTIAFFGLSLSVYIFLFCCFGDVSYDPRRADSIYELPQLNQAEPSEDSEGIVDVTDEFTSEFPVLYHRIPKNEKFNMQSSASLPTEEKHLNNFKPHSYPNAISDESLMGISEELGDSHDSMPVQILQTDL